MEDQILEAAQKGIFVDDALFEAMGNFIILRIMGLAFTLTLAFTNTGLGLHINNCLVW